ncbi:MAG: glycosyltransferase family 2 protein [Candidatus Krumholzibacteria bacterium]|nr:glycosyltransferase family 2 protein [Candidatus Krumholzibacteria bacterium]MDH4336692.1 glycosyltransferase family 2 protein [Candidatus Krumholzibacteria bacterium]MDH5270813.1 glycosyltransferase family 2 protein [Candidatus Krumholzibacteria bacterium]
MKISLVVPCYNEQDSLPELYEQIEAVMAQMGCDYEYVFVDDGSTDRTVAVLRELARKSPRVGVISFRRNYGKSAALQVGFRAVDGDFVVTIDADLQDDPAEIPALLRKIEGGADLVSGWKTNRQDPPSKTLPSRLFNATTSAVTGIKLHDFNCGLKMYRREVTDAITVYGELHRFIPALAAWEGFRVDEIGVRHYKRKYGKSKYGARRFLNGFFDLVTTMFVTRRALNPLHFFGRIAVVLFALGLTPQVFFLVQWIAGDGLRVRPIMLLGFVLIIVALQIASIGLLAELITARGAREAVYAFKEYDVRGRHTPADAARPSGA